VVGCAQSVARWIGKISARGCTGGCRTNGNGGTIAHTAGTIAHAAIDVDIAIDVDMTGATATRTTAPAATARASQGIRRDTHGAKHGNCSKGSNDSM
jgi:hypothetical protein